MVKNRTELTRRNGNMIALGPLLEACQEAMKVEKVWR
jgi:hypothetical protein